MTYEPSERTLAIRAEYAAKRDLDNRFRAMVDVAVPRRGKHYAARGVRQHTEAIARIEAEADAMLARGVSRYAADLHRARAELHVPLLASFRDEAARIEAHGVMLGAIAVLADPAIVN